MASPKNLDPAFQGAGQRLGTEIWRIENFQPVPLPESNYGKFYSGDSYIVLQTTTGKGGAYLFDIHFWVGKDTSQDEAGTAAIKTVELDAVLGGRAVQHRELQGHESDKFLSYFKPCIVPLEGGVASGFKKAEEEKFETRLYICRGKRAVRLKQVPFARSSLNHDDVFILDTENKIYQFNGANSNIQERAKALEVIQHLKEQNHDGICEVAIIDDGKLEVESGSGEFWVLLGGFAPIGRKTVSEDDMTLESTPGKLYSIEEGQLRLEEGTLTKEMLENNKCYLLDCGSEIFVWTGRVTQVEERISARKAAEEYISNENRPKATSVTQIIQGFETQSFKSKFESWPLGTGTGTPGGEEGRGIVAALLKQQGFDAKVSSKGSPVNEEIPPLLEGSGKLEVWRINENAKTPIATEDIGKFYCGDCYIVLYTYHTGDKKEEYFLSCWIGKDSVQDDHAMSYQVANAMCNSLKSRPVQGRIFQGKEPPQFVALFQPMVVLKGGVSSGYKKYISDRGLTDDTYSSNGIALFRVSGIAVHNNQAVQVDAKATSLCSDDCFLLQSGSSVFNWHGSSSTFEQQEWAAKVAEFLKPGGVMKHVKEGTEGSAFWFTLGGKQTFTTKKITEETFRDPHLYTFSTKEGKTEVSEVFNFCQDDLLREDILILDTNAEVFVWVGHCVDPKDKEKAFDIGQKYIEFTIAPEGLSPDVPLFKVTEGNEPCFFTTYFSWDNKKATVHGNSFQKKLSILFGTSHAESNDKSGNSNQSGPTQRASALAALTSAFNPSNPSKDKMQASNTGAFKQRAKAVAALSAAFRSSSSSSEKTYNSNPGEYKQRAQALEALASAFNPSDNTSNDKTYSSNPGEFKQRAEALAALTSAFNASYTSSDKTYDPNPGEPKQRAEALAALLSAFNPSNTPNEKAYSSNPGEFKQRAEALAALSSALNPSDNSNEKTYSSNPGEHKQRGEALAALLSAFNPSNTQSVEKTHSSNPGEFKQRAEALAALTSAFNASSSYNEKEYSSNPGEYKQRAEALAALLSAFNPSDTSNEKTYNSNPGEHKQRAEALAALTSAFKGRPNVPKPPPPPSRGSQWSAAVAALSNVLPAGEASKRISRSPSQAPSENSENALSEIEDVLDINTEDSAGEGDSMSENNEAGTEEIDDSQLLEENEGTQQTFSYERLTSKSTNPVRGIDYKRREVYLSDEDFQTVFGISKEEFYQQPKWKQDMQKRNLDLF